jgi:hypothetical protein
VSACDGRPCQDLSSPDTTSWIMSVHAPSLPASPSLRAADVRRMFQTPTTSVAGPSTVSPAQSGSSPSLAAVNTNAALHHHGRRPHVSRNRFHTELSQCLYDFVIQLLPTAEELRIKEDVRKLLERLIRTIEPSSRLLSFGSMANGFALRNSGELIFHETCSLVF